MTTTIERDGLAARLRVRLRNYLAMARSLPQGEIDERTMFKLEVIIPNVGLTIERLQNGEHGDCLDCGEPIPEKRLQLIPAVLRCVHCQNDLEENRARSR